MYLPPLLFVLLPKDLSYQVTRDVILNIIVQILILYVLPKIQMNINSMCFGILSVRLALMCNWYKLWLRYFYPTILPFDIIQKYLI